MKIRNTRAIGALIRERRQELRLDQQSLANRIGASRYWVVQMEQGKEGAEIGRVLRALDALDLVIDVTKSTSTAKPSKEDMRVRIPVVDIDAVVDAARRKSTLSSIDRKAKGIRRRKQVAKKHG